MSEERKPVDHKVVTNLIHALFGQDNVVPIPRALVLAMKHNVIAVMVYMQLAYWSARAKGPWLYKSVRELCEELGLTAHQVRGAVTALRSLGLVTTKLKKADGSPTLHYQLDRERLAELLMASSDRFAPERKTVLGQSANP